MTARGCGERGATDEGARLCEWLRLVTVCIPGTLWATDRDLRITACAGARCCLGRLGQHPREVVGVLLGDVVGTDDEGALQIAMHQRALAGERVAFGWRAGQRFYRCSVDAVRDGDGSIIGVVGVAVDETEHEAERMCIVEAERRLAQAQAVAHVGSWERDLDSDRAVWSDETLRLFGICRADFDGTMAAQLRRCHPDDVELVKQAYAVAARRSEPVELDYRLVRADGSVRVVHSQMQMFGPGRRLIGATQDVTESRAAEQRLKTALSLLNAALESTADGLLVVDREGRIVQYNAKFATIWRLPSDVLSTRDDARVLAFVLDQVVDPEAFSAKIRTMYAQPERESYDEIRLDDGRLLERYSQAQRIDGKAVGRVWSFRDVTDARRALAVRDRLLAKERQAREAAQASERRAKLLAEASRFLASLDPESALGSLAHLVSESFADCCTIDLIEPDGSLRRIALAPDGERAGALPLCSPEPATHVAEEADLAVLGVPLAVGGRLLGTMRVARSRARGFCAKDLELAEDVAGRAALAVEIARLHQRTEEALRARDEFLSVASHELRTPLATLQATTDALLAGAHGSIPAGSTLTRPLSSIARQVRRLSRLVNQILDAIGFSTRGIELHLTDVDLSAITHAAVDRIRTDWVGSEAALTVSAPGQVLGRWDRARIEQLIQSLVSNALRYGAGKPVAVGVERRGDVALLTVQDHGVGISPAHLPGLFGRFDRAGASRSLGGLGLGLYIDHGIVTLHGGTIRVESRKGEGTMFFVELPLTGPTGRQTEVGSQATRGTEGQSEHERRVPK